MAKVIESAAFCILSGGKPSSEDLHSQQCKNENEKDQQDQESVDGGNGVDKTLDEVSHTCPISITRKKIVEVSFYKQVGYDSGGKAPFESCWYLVTLNALRRRIQRNTDIPENILKFENRGKMF